MDADSQVSDHELQGAFVTAEGPLVTSMRSAVTTFDV